MDVHFLKLRKIGSAYLFFASLIINREIFVTQQKLTCSLGYPHLTDGYKQSRFSRMTRAMGQVVVALFAAHLMIHQPVMAAVILVDGTCTLVDAINAANTDSASGNCLAGSGADEIQVTVDVSLMDSVPAK